MKNRRLTLKRSAIVAALVLISSLLLSASTMNAQTAAGDLDFSFGNGGKAITNLNGDTNELTCALAVEPDGTLIAVGTDKVGLNADFIVLRYHGDGSLDKSFGSRGKVHTDFGADDRATAVAIYPGGKLIVAGYSGYSNTFRVALARYRSDGSLDATFGSGGQLLTDFLGDSNLARAIFLQPDGKIVVAGSSRELAGTGYDFGLARFNNDGSLDTTFGSGGKVRTDFFDNNNECYAAALQPDGKIVAVGYAFAPFATGQEFALARYNSDGSLDPTFGSGGKVTTDFFGSRDEAHGLALQPDGRIIAGGMVLNVGGGSSYDFGLARYNADGTLDNTFGTGGKAITSFSSSDLIHALALQPDLKIVAAGLVYHPSSGYDIGLARFTGSGNLDSSFGTSGQVETNLGWSEYGRSVVVQPSGRIIVAGYTDDGDTGADLALVGYYGESLPTPRITSATVSGKKLIVMGENFGGGAVILLNDERQKTVNDATNPDTILIGKKAGKKVRLGDKLRVQNADGTISSEFVFTGS